MAKPTAKKSASSAKAAKLRKPAKSHPAKTSKPPRAERPDKGAKHPKPHREKETGRKEGRDKHQSAAPRIVINAGEERQAHASGNGNGSPGAPATKEGFDIQEKVKELVRLSKEQGYLTYNDINDALPENIVTGDELDEIYTKLHNLDVEIVDQAEVDVVKQPEPEEEENKEDAKMRLDILDDPVRMYLKQIRC
jgi:RNA polymerase primary sigma factor